MKTLLTFLTVCLFYAPAFSQAGKFNNEVTAYELVKIFSTKHAEKLPQGLRSIPLKKIKAKNNRISFYFKGAYIRLDAIGTKNKVLLLNGRAFSRKDLTTSKSIHLAIISKFGLTPKKTMSQFFYLVSSRAFASTSPVSPLEEDFGDSTSTDNPFYGVSPAEPTTAQNTGATETQFDGQDYDVFDLGDSPSLGDSFVARRLQAPFDLMTGQNQAAMLKFLDSWLGGFNQYLGGGSNSALARGAAARGIGGLGAGTQLTQFLQLGTSPSLIPTPY